jgi:hypothetical protein
MNNVQLFYSKFEFYSNIRIIHCSNTPSWQVRAPNPVKYCYSHYMNGAPPRFM